MAQKCNIYIPVIKIYIKVVVLHAIQQSGSYWDRSSALSLMGVEPTLFILSTIYQMPNLLITTRPWNTLLLPYKTSDIMTSAAENSKTVCEGLKMSLQNFMCYNHRKPMLCHKLSNDQL